MLKIKRLKIKNFRSIVDLDIKVENMNIFVGLNDAGKSNVLKALNLFFNDETEPGMPYDFNVDYSKYAPVRKKKAKEIVISIVFSIPERYSYHEDVEWVKIWRKDGLHSDSSVKWDFMPHSKVPTLLKRAKYKYVPAIKSDNYFKILLADLYVSIAKEANNELVEKAADYSKALDSFTEAIGYRVQNTVGIKSNLIMPSNQIDIFKELIFITSDESGENINLSYRGDGIKAVHIPAILKYISEQDNRLMNNTAVPITYIWGYEEPENGIEMKKCFDLARELLGFSSNIQEFITTHSPAFYRLGNEEGAKVYYIYKGENSYFSQICDNLDSIELHDKVGIMPIIAPIIEKKEIELQNLREIISQVKIIDKPVIFVEGITDKLYLELAIELFSPKLNEKMKQGNLNVVTREENGCGVNLLVDWAIAWMHMNYNSKAVVLLDSDEAGLKAKKAIDEEKKRIKKNSKLNAVLLQPTDDFKYVNSKIKKGIYFTIEHLLSYEFWEYLKKREFIEKRKAQDLYSIFINVINENESLNMVIDKYVNNPELKDTVISYIPKDEKKKEIFELVKENVHNNRLIMDGFKNTIIKLETEFI